MSFLQTLNLMFLTYNLRFKISGEIRQPQLMLSIALLRCVNREQPAGLLRFWIPGILDVSDSFEKKRASNFAMALF